MPRRTRVQVPVRRKRTPPPAARRGVVDGPESLPPAEEGDGVEASVPAPYIRREARVEVSTPRDSVERPAFRQARALVTDYSYVLSELEKVGYTFAGLILLLIVISRLLH